MFHITPYTDFRKAYQAVVPNTDFRKAYQAVVPKEQHQACGKGRGWTNTVERFNLTLRQRMGRMVRKTLSFSKSWAMHLLCLRLFIDGYNRYCKRRFAHDIIDKKMLATTREP